jgi:arabinofuranosyltransferase
MAGAHALGARGQALPSVANVLSIGAAVGLLFLVARMAARRLETGVVATAATAVFLGSLAPFALWATSGLETMPFALALFGVYERLQLDRERPRGLQAGLWAVAAGLLRADGFGWIGAVLVAVVLAGPRERRAALVRAALVAALITAVGVGAHFLWRHSYYEEWMPNTARVKAGFTGMRLERGYKYVVTFLLSVPAFAVVPLAALASRGRRAPAIVWSGLFVVLVALAYALYVGGDFMPMGRFFVPAAPFLALLFAAVFQALEPRRLALPLGAAVIVVGVLLGVNVLRWPTDLLQTFHFRWNSKYARSEYEQWGIQKYQADTWAVVGRALARHTQPGESMIRGPVGAVGYYTDLYLYDMNGLVLPEIAKRDEPLARRSPGHDKHVPWDYFFPQQPTYLGAMLVEAGAPEHAGISPMLLENQGVLRMMRQRRVRVDRFPLDPDEGFLPGFELRVMRFLW